MMITSTILRRCGTSCAASRCSSTRVGRRAISTSSYSSIFKSLALKSLSSAAPSVEAAAAAAFETAPSSSPCRLSHPPTTTASAAATGAVTLAKRNKSTQAKVATTSSSATSNIDALHLWQKQCWETYLSTGRGSKTLFQAIDTNHNHTISVNELHFFLDSIGSSIGIHPRAFKMLDELTHDHQLTFKEFSAWLVVATKFGIDHKNSSFLQEYESSPNLGERKVDEEVEGDEDDDDRHYHSWNETKMSQSVRRMQYAVRGKLVLRAETLQAEGKDILFTNVGNPHSVGQQPISYYRQVMALCDLPVENGIDNPNISLMFPHEDIVERAKYLRNICIGSSGTGAYTGSQGILEFRQDVANYIMDRDGGTNDDTCKSYPGNIFLTNGASSGIEYVMTTLIADINDAIMIPIPQYPIYSGTSVSL